MTRPYSTGRTLTILIFSLSIPFSAWAQFARGTITGTVKDSTGAVIPGAAVIVTSEQTGSQVKTQSSTSGVYLALQLLPGNYSVSCQAAGFKHLTIGTLKVDVNTTVTQDLTLEVGQISESVQVTGETSLVQTNSGQFGSVVSINQVLEIPLQDRNVFNLVNLVPGAMGLNYGESPANAWFLNVSLGGGRFQQTMPFVDGVNGTQSGANMQNIDISPPVDAMQEFRVEINNLSAEFGRTPGGVLNAVTKSGTNQFHGSLYEFLRNDKFDANGWGNDSKPPLKRNIFGGTFGGPLLKNRTFIFYNYDGLRNRQSTAATRNVGLPEWRSGNFSTATRQVGNSAAPLLIYDPNTGSGTFGNPRGTLQFPGNIIPASRLDPVAVKVLSNVPSPNRSPDNPFTQAGNFQLNQAPRYLRDYHTIRLDHEISSATKMFARYIQTGPEGTTTPVLGGFGVVDPQAATQQFQRQNGAVNVTHLFSPTFFLSYTMGVHHFFQHNKNGPCCDTDWGSELGIPNAHGTAFPRFSLGGGGLLPFTDLGANSQVFITETNWNYIVNFTKIRGNHAVKFGAQYDRLGGNRGSTQTNGLWAFDGHFSQGVDANGIQIPNTGANLADFLLGRVNSVAATFTPSLGVRLQVYGGYVQDDWRVSRNLTLNLGIRYDTATPSYGIADRYSNYDPYAPNPLAGTGDIPVGATGVARFQNRNGEGRYLYDWNMMGFAPRFGFAYRVFGTNDTVVRGGYGIFYGRDSGGGLNALTLLNPFSQAFNAANPVPFRLQDGFPANSVVPVPESQLTATYGTRGTPFQQSAFDFNPQKHRTPYTQNFNLTIQRQFRGMLIEAGYLGNLGRQVQAPGTNINLIPPHLLSNTAIPARLRRPFTSLASDQPAVTFTYAAWGVSNYHGFVFKLERRLRNGLSWTVSYTLSKLIDNVHQTSTTGATFGDNLAPQNIYNRAGEKSLATNHVPQRLVISPIVELPFGKGRRWLNHGGVVNAILGGWQISTFGTMQKGSPFGSQVVNGTRTLLGDPAAPQLRPNVVGELNSSNQGQPAVGVRGIQWLNPSAFAAPPLYTFGNLSRTLPGVLRPALVNFDSMVAKNFQIREKFRAQFRWETFNTSNTPYWGLPATQLGGGNLGVISSASSRRIMQLGLKLYW